MKSFKQIENRYVVKYTLPKSFTELKVREQNYKNVFNKQNYYLTFTKLILNLSNLKFFLEPNLVLKSN